MRTTRNEWHVSAANYGARWRGGGEYGDGGGGGDEDGAVHMSARQKTDGQVHREQQPELRQGR